MNIYINPEKSPAAIQAKASGSPISGLRFKRGANLNLSVVVLGCTSASKLRFGIKAKGDYEGALLVYASADNGITEEDGTRFELSLAVSSEALNTAFNVGSGNAATAASISAVAEFAWQENGAERLTDTINTTLLNDIIRLATDVPEAAAGEYPAPDLVATKSWVNSKQATADTSGFVMLGTDETISGKQVRPVGKAANGGLAVDVSGASAYEIAVANGFSGSESAWLESLKGERGTKGEAGKDADMDEMVSRAVTEITTAGTETKHSTTATGTDNAEFYWCEMNASHIPTGKLTSLAIQCRSASGKTMTTSACYLGIWELDDAGEPVLLGVSSNAAVQTIGQATDWAFDNIPLSGRAIRICLLPTQEAEWLAGNLCFGARVSPCADSCCMVSTTSQAYLPQIEFTYEATLPRFAHVSHVSDTNVHISNDERQKLDEIAPCDRDGCKYALYLSCALDGTFTKVRDLISDDEMQSLSSHLAMNASTAGWACTLGEYAVLVYKPRGDWNGNDFLLDAGYLLNEKFNLVRYFNFPFGQ